MRSFALPALALAAFFTSTANAQVVFDATEEMGQDYVIEEVNPRAAQLLRSIDAYHMREFIPAEQFRNLPRPYKNAGVWATSPYTIMRRVAPELGDPNYYEMKDQLKMKMQDPTQQVKQNEPAPRAIIKIPVEPERKPINPNADQGRITIRPYKAPANTATAVVSR